MKAIQAFAIFKITSPLLFSGWIGHAILNGSPFMDGSFYSNCNMAPPLSQWTRFAMERVAYDQNRSVYSQFLSGTDGEGIGSCIVVRISHFGSVRQHRVGAVAAFYPYAPAKADAAGARIVSLHPYSSGYEPFLLYSAYARRFEDGKALYTRFSRPRRNWAPLLW